MRKIYKYKDAYYELKKKGDSVSTFYMLDNNMKRISKKKDVSNRNKQRYGVIPEIYEVKVSAKIIKEGELVQQPDTQEKLF